MYIVTVTNPDGSKSYISVQSKKPGVVILLWAWRIYATGYQTRGNAEIVQKFLELEGYNGVEVHHDKNLRLVKFSDNEG